MPHDPEMFGVDHLDDFRVAYEGEVAGEVYFATMASWHTGDARHALGLFAQVERITSTALRPVVLELGVAVADPATLRQRGIENAEAERTLSWDELVIDMCEHYPRYVREFERMLAISPPQYRAAAQLMLDHEVALVDAAQLLRDGMPNALQPVIAFIERG